MSLITAIFLGVLIGMIIIYFMTEIDNSQNVYDLVYDQNSDIHKQLKKELELLVPHKLENKYEAIISNYKFSIEQANYSLLQIEEHLENLQQHYKQSLKLNTVFKTNFPKNEEIRLSPLATFNVVTLLNEGLHNAAVYSDATHIVNIISIEDENLRIITHDNGKGFDKIHVNEGAGIHAIRSIVEKYKGYLSLTSTLGNGTIVNALLENIL